VRLGDICFVNPKAPSFDDYFTVSFVPMPKVGENGEFDPSEIKEYHEVKKGFTYFQNGDILFAKITPCMENGKGAVAHSMENGIGFGSTEFHVLRPKNSDVVGEWIYYLLSWSDFRKEAEKNMTGSAGQKRVPKSFLENYPVTIPAKEDQKKQVHSLQTIDTLISLRKQQLAKLDELVKARFVELFGDPVTNPKGWDMPLIEDVVANEKNALKAGPFGSALKKEYYVSSGYKIYGQEQVISGDHTFGDYYIDEDRYKSLENCAVQFGDVLISLVGTYGKLLVMPEEFEPGIINPRLMKITFDKKRVNPYYFQHYFQSDSLKKALAENTHGGTMDILNLGIVRKLAMPLPPLELQNEFIAFVKQTDKSKFIIQQSLNKLETLKKALMQKYFG